MEEVLALMATKNLTSIKWAHAINEAYLLEKTLRTDVDMIEADVVMGKSPYNADMPARPIVAHPPVEKSLLDLDYYLDLIREYHDRTGGKRIKGIKLDFKTIEAFEGSLPILDKLIPQMKCPVWLNADIISGPINDNTYTPVDPARFFAGCARYKQAVISIGWTTRWNADTPRDGAYDQHDIKRMLNAVIMNNVLATGQTITFAVRAGIAANSKKELLELMRSVNNSNNATLTIWSAPIDYVDVKKLRSFIWSVGVDRVYLDVPVALKKKLNLGRAMATIESLTHFTLMNISFWAFTMCLRQLSGK